VSINNLM